MIGSPVAGTPTHIQRQLKGRCHHPNDISLRAIAASLTCGSADSLRSFR